MNDVTWGQYLREAGLIPEGGVPAQTDRRRGVVGGHSDNPLERAFMARIRGDEYRAELKALQDEFDEREDVVALKRRIDRCEEERHNCIEQAKVAGVSKQGDYVLKIRTRKTRTVIPKLFFARHGAEAFIECCTVAIGRAEALLGKGTFDDCCEVEVRETGVSVEYERPEARG